MGRTTRKIDQSDLAAEATDCSGDRFLLIEDDPGTALAMTRLMKAVGITVQTVGTVKDGIAALSQMPTVVILDLMLPDGCGVEVLEAVRAAKMRCKVAVVSASTNEQIFARMNASRPDAVFSKPLDFEDFVKWLCEEFPESAGRSSSRYVAA
jgi:two-component system response regulator QseB